MLAPLDVNHDGKLTASELGSASVAASVLSRDRDGDGFVTPDELYRNVQEPRTVFARTRELRLGGESITLLHAPLTEERDAVVVLFPSQKRLAFASIVPAIAPLPAPFGVNSPKDLDRWFRQMNSLSFYWLISGTGDEFSHEQIAGAAADLTRSAPLRDGCRAERAIPTAGAGSGGTVISGSFQTCPRRAGRVAVPLATPRDDVVLRRDERADILRGDRHVL